ncbi:MAG: glutamine amidotransferase [Isosphaeraceae bacterium]|nr:glutamine amidotransferase [Isosphaeraceae bacterium]
MLPVDLLNDGRDWSDALTSLQPVAGRSLHPIWHISTDESQNRALLKTLPDFRGHNRLGRPKSGADVLAEASSSGATDGPFPGIAVQPYGRGRSMAMSTAITRRWASDFTQSWGGADARYYKKFWRNVIYWLTENSSIGRRRLLAETDKRLYRPGEPIVIQARTFDENAAPTLDYRVAVSIEPRSAGDVTSDDSPLRRAVSGSPPSEGEAHSPMLPWGEEFDLTRNAAEKSYAALLPIIDAKSVPAGVALTQGLRIELTAYENNTQVDSTALEVQVLDDPSEQQNPLPDHDLLRRVADRSSGKVLKGAGDLASMIAALPHVVGPTEVKRAPVWSRWWLLALLLVLLTTEWVWRRRLGLA